eukprot:9402999-Pyramimonas_sp.AAC.1
MKRDPYAKDEFLDIKQDLEDTQNTLELAEEVPGPLPVEPISPTQPWPSQEVESISGPQVSITGAIEVETTQDQIERQVMEIDQVHAALSAAEAPTQLA